MIFELSSVSRFVMFEGLDHRSHGVIENDDPIPKKLSEDFSGVKELFHACYSILHKGHLNCCRACSFESRINLSMSNEYVLQKVPACWQRLATAPPLKMPSCSGAVT